MARPKIRNATPGDIAAIYEIILESRDRSRYAGEVADVVRARALLMQAIQRHGVQTASGAFIAVADTGDRLEGFILGVLQPFYLIGETLEATDVFWLVRDGAHGATAMRLLKAMHKWVPEGAYIRHGNSDAISDIETTGRLLERAGLRLIGHVYEKKKE